MKEINYHARLSGAIVCFLSGSLAAVFLLGCVPRKSDEIDRVVKILSEDHTWEQGAYPNLELPANAATDQVVARVVKLSESEKHPIHTCKIVTTRQVRIPGQLPDPYTAVLVDTDMGTNVVLLNHTGPMGDWWYRVIKVKD